MNKTQTGKPRNRIVFSLLIGSSLALALVTGIVLNNNNFSMNSTNFEENQQPTIVETYLDPKVAQKIIEVTPETLVGAVEREALATYASEGDINPAGLAYLDAYMSSFYLINLADIEKHKNDASTSTEELEAYLESFSMEYRSEKLPEKIEQIVSLREKLGFNS